MDSQEVAMSKKQKGYLPENIYFPVEIHEELKRREKYYPISLNYDSYRMLGSMLRAASYNLAYGREDESALGFVPMPAPVLRREVPKAQIKDMLAVAIVHRTNYSREEHRCRRYRVDDFLAEPVTDSLDDYELYA